ncbi:hypothetical protein CKO09_11625 [Chromatium weissei]|nr:hypothetical protein [Chromatium weissei]
MERNRNRAHGIRQRKHVNRIAKRCPCTWTEAEKTYATNNQRWQKWCYLPIQYWREIAHCCTLPLDPLDLARLAVLGSWRVTQGIYRFDPDLYTALTETPRVNPDDLLLRLPAWGVYLEMPGMVIADVPIIGCYASWNIENTDPALWLLLDPDDPTDFTFSRFVFRQWQPNTAPNDIAPILSLLQAVCDAQCEHPGLTIINTRKHEQLMLAPEHVTYCLVVNP